MTYRVLTRTADADRAIVFAKDAVADLRSIERQCWEITRNAKITLARAISEARKAGYSLDELAPILGKSSEWVRQAEKKGQAS